MLHVICNILQVLRLLCTVMGMKRYKKLLFQVGILLFIIAIFLFVLEQQKKFITVDFSKLYEANKTIELSGFEQTENWRGNYTYDSERFFEGKTSVVFSSWYGKENSIQKESSTVLRDGYTKGYISLFISDKQKKDSIRSLKAVIENDKQNKEYDLTSQLLVGWNKIVIVIPAWKNISKISFHILAKEGDVAEVNLDRFWVENSSQYMSDIIVTKSKSLSLRTIGDRTYLFVATPDFEQFHFEQPAQINRGIVTLSFIPEHAKKIQLLIDGTGVEIAGESMNLCTLTEKNMSVKKQALKSTKAPDDMYVFLKAEFKGDKIAYSVSNNGVTYEQCGVTTKSSSSGVTLGLQGSYLIDSYSVEY